MCHTLALNLQVNTSCFVTTQLCVAQKSKYLCGYKKEHFLTYSLCISVLSIHTAIKFVRAGMKLYKGPVMQCSNSIADDVTINTVETKTGIYINIMTIVLKLHDYK